MICKKCGAELPDLTMYCPECGTAQYGANTKEVKLEMAGPKKSKVVIKEISNMTNAILVIRNQTGQSMPEVRKMLSELPCDYRTGLSQKDADVIVADLGANGIIAEAIHPAAAQAKEEALVEPAEEAAPVEIAQDAAVVEEGVAEEPVPVEEATPVEENEAVAPVEEVAAPVEEPVAEEAVGFHLTLEPELKIDLEPEEVVEASVTHLTLEPEHKIDVEDEEPCPIQLTLDPDHKGDDEFMKEMEEFLNGSN